MDKGEIPVLGGAKWNSTSSHHAAQDGAQFRIHEMFISAVFHLAFSDWLRKRSIFSRLWISDATASIRGDPVSFCSRFLDTLIGHFALQRCGSLSNRNHFSVPGGERFRAMLGYLQHTPQSLAHSAE